MAGTDSCGGGGRLPVLLFDLDGTLLDTAGLHQLVLRHLLQARRLQPPSPQAVAQVYGLPLEQILDHFLGPGLPQPLLRQAVKEYVDFYLTHCRGQVRAYPGVAGALRALRLGGLRVGVVTSKRRGPALGDLEETGLAEWVEVVVAHEDAPRHKPDPSPVLTAMEALGGVPAGTVMVGDSWLDLEAGRAAGAATALALWGALDRERALAAGPDVVLEEPGELMRFLAVGERGAVSGVDGR